MLGNRLDPSWFSQSDGVGPFGDHFARLAAHAIAELPAGSNYFLAQIFLGRYRDERQVPDYLRREHFETIRSRVDRISTVTADVVDALAAIPSGTVDAFALSNVFEYSPPDVFERAKRELRRAARPGARVSLRNLLAPRRLAADPAFAVDPVLSDRLRQADRGFIYSRFEAARVR
jgi:S-adenosylmethionine-diacylglycerol 3-amino-3-carboxypropyl transferase